MVWFPFDVLKATKLPFEASNSAVIFEASQLNNSHTQYDGYKCSQ